MAMHFEQYEINQRVIAKRTQLLARLLAEGWTPEIGDSAFQFPVEDLIRLGLTKTRRKPDGHGDYHVWYVYTGDRPVYDVERGLVLKVGDYVGLPD